MKYIKLFEYMNWDNIKLSEEEFYNKVRVGEEQINPQKFTDKEIELIESEFKRPNIKIINRKYYKDEFGRQKDLKSGNQLDILVDCEYEEQKGKGYDILKANKDTIKQISIWKDEDEWFYVRIHTSIYGRNYKEKAAYYKCDQIDGLIQKLSQLI